MASSLSTFVLAAASVMFQETTRIGLGVEWRVALNKDIRDFTNSLADEAREANDFRVYDSFFTSNGVASFRSPASESSFLDYQLNPGEAGEFCVFVYYGDDPNPSDNVPPPVEKLVGYLVDSDNTGDGEEMALKRFEVIVPASSQSLAVEEIIPAQDAAEGFKVIAEQIRGLFTADGTPSTSGGKLFYNIEDRSVLVSGEIIHSTKGGGHRFRKESSGTYNFTVSPRG